MADPIIPSISLGGFVEFASAMSSGRITAVQNVIANEFGGYEPSHDFYRQFRIAIAEGIANGDDALRIRRAVDECTPKRRSHYEALATGWNRWRRGKNLEVFSQPLPWHASGLEVRVSPQFIYRAKSEPLLVWPYFKDAELSRDGIQAAIRLTEMTHPNSERRPAVLDVRRGTLHHAAKRRRKGFDAWLTSEAAAFISLLESIRNVA
ncbi:hypothetical protein CQY20_31975 [Mycolicibacterium agri]|uniref:Uncharacterized protein n=1 Tax=Mycolicibacterium agri TaxID=36811 RepID=A0A2A7MNF8_MYCAG|nr:hypothetical protein [Mycolicibacterium agri]PEG33216.1 hypothetical protein CQY20_31975 [Mycolicibacterium agri]GFG50146.1 hypothetical protein MAGR_15870 [Mycolicibacterium agri]